jgi:Leucine-rich repeat (LRR) protein
VFKFGLMHFAAVVSTNLAVLATCAAAEKPNTTDKPPPTSEAIERWANDLDDADYAKRQAAQKNLISAGAPAMAAVAHLAVVGGPEARIRARKIIDSLANDPAARAKAMSALEKLAEHKNKRIADPAMELISSLETATLRLVARGMKVEFHANGRVKSLTNKDGGSQWWAKDHDFLHIATFSQLSQLDLSGDPIDDVYNENPLTDEGLVGLKSLPHLTHLNLEGTKITDDGLKHLAPLTKLKSLNLSWSRITGRGLEHLRALNELESLDLSVSYFTESPGLGELKSLRALNLTDTTVTDKGLEYIARLHELRELHLHSPRMVKRGRYARSPFSEAGLLHLRSLTKLERLAIGLSNDVGDAGLASLRDLVALRWLRLDYANHVTDAGLAYLEPLTKLEYLELGQASVTGPGLVHLKGMTNLRVLELGWHKLAAEGFVHLPFLPALESFSSGCLRGEPVIPHLNKMTRLEKFSFWPITDGVLAQLEGLERVRGLSCSEKVTDAGLKSIGKIAGIRSLSLRNTQITDAGLAHLKSLDGLQGLSLDGTRITDEGLRHLARLASLQRVSLIGTRVTNAGIAHLERLKSLKTVDAQSTKVTQAGAERLKSKLPECSIAVTVEPQRRRGKRMR